MAVDYFGIHESLATLIKNEVGQFKAVLIEAMDRELTLDNMPLCNVRLVSGEQEVRSLPNSYYLFLTFEIDVIAFSLTLFKEAATLRDSLLGAAQDAIQANRNFHVDLQTSSLVPSIRFGALAPEGAGGHVAVATFTVRCEAYIEAQ